MSSEFRVYRPESIGEAIRHFRSEEGMTQSELARRTHLNRTYLSELEQGKNTEQLTRIIRILKQLGVRITLQKADW